VQHLLERFFTSLTSVVLLLPYGFVQDDVSFCITCHILTFCTVVTLLTEVQSTITTNQLEVRAVFAVAQGSPDYGPRSYFIRSTKLLCQ